MASPINPYSPPGSAVADVRAPGTDTQFTVPGVKVGAGRGASWIGEGWTLFRAAPLLWIVALLILVGVQFLLSLIPLLGPIANALLYPVFMLGVLAFGKAVAEGEPADIAHLFVGFREKLGPLVTVGALYLLMIVAVIVVCGGLFFVVLGSADLFNVADPEAAMTAAIFGPQGALLLVVLLLMVGLMVLVAAAYWFAPGLVYFTDLGAWEAMKASFSACLRNWLPFLVYGLLAVLVMLAGMLVIFIGLFLVSLPVLVASYYSSFLDVFGRKA